MVRIGFFCEGDECSPVERPGSDTRPIENLWRIYSTINEWIRACDMKAGLILATSGVISTVIATAGGTALSRLLVVTPSTVFLWLAILALVFSGFFSTSCIAPRVRPLSPGSLIFFGNIAGAYKTHDEYADAWQKYATDLSLLESDLRDQIWANSLVANCKFAAINKATIALALAILFVLVSGLFVFTLSKPG